MWFVHMTGVDRMNPPIILLPVLTVLSANLTSDPSPERTPVHEPFVIPPSGSFGCFAGGRSRLGSGGLPQLVVRHEYRSSWFLCHGRGRRWRIRATDALRQRCRWHFHPHPRFRNLCRHSRHL